MMDDDYSVSPSVVSVSAIPRCCCSWKNCRSYQKTLRDKEHPTWNGAIKFRFDSTKEEDMRLKQSIDRILDVLPERRDKWKDGICKYFVARHHFTQDMMKKSIAKKRSWVWVEPLNVTDARKYLWELNEADTVQITDTEIGYLKVPNVPKDHVKEILQELKGNDDEPPQSLEGMLNSLVGAVEDDSTKKKKKKKISIGDEGSVVSTKSKSKSKKKVGSDDASVVSTKSSKLSSKQKKDKKAEGGDEVSVVSTKSKKDKKKKENSTGESDVVLTISTKSKKDNKKKAKSITIVGGDIGDDVSVLSTKSKKDKKKKNGSGSSKKKMSDEGDASATIEAPNDGNGLEGMLSSLSAMDDTYDDVKPNTGDSAAAAAADIANLKSELEKAKAATSEVESKLRAELEEEKMKLKQLEETTKKQVEDVEKSNATVEKLKQELEEAQIKTASQAETLKSISRDDESQKENVASLDARIEELETQLSDAQLATAALGKQSQKDLDAERDISSKYQAKAADLEKQIEESTRSPSASAVKTEGGLEGKREYSELGDVEKFIELEQKLQEAESRNKEQQYELEELRDKLESAANKVDEDLKVESNKLQVLVDELTKEKEALKVENQNLVNATGDLEDQQQEQTESFRSELVEYETKIRDLQNEIESLKAGSVSEEASATLNTEYRQAIEKLQADLEEAENDHLKETTALKATISEHEQGANTAAAELEEAKETAIKLRKTICELQDNHKRDTDELNGKVAALERESAALGAAAVVTSRAAGSSTSRSLASAPESNGSEDISMDQAIHRLQKEKLELERMNLNQQNTIRKLETDRSPDGSDEAKAIAKREDELERGTALLANIYFTKKNMNTLSKRGLRINHRTGAVVEDPPEEDSNEQWDMLQSHMEKKQKNWWQKVDKIFKYSDYLEPMPA